MNGENLWREVTKQRPVDGDCFVAGYTIRRGDSFRVEFLKYRNSGGIVGKVSMREMASIAPDLIKALKADGAKVKDYVLAEDSRREAFDARMRSTRRHTPTGSGSFERSSLLLSYRQDRAVCDCNAIAGSDYARQTAQNAPDGAGAAPQGSAAPNATEGQLGGFGRESRANARGRERGNV